MSADLSKLELELVNTNSVFIDLEDLIDFLKAVLSADWKRLHDIAPGSDNNTKEKLNTEKDKCLSAVRRITKYDGNIRWATLTECRS